MKSKTKKEEIKVKQVPPRIVIKFKDDPNLPYTSDEELRKYLIEKNIIPLGQLDHKYKGITLNRIFNSIEPERILELVSNAKKLNPDYNPPNFFTYCAIDCPYEIDAKELLQELRKNINVELAYIKSPPCSSPCNFIGTNPDNVKQGYLDHAPIGIDARHAWGVNGGCGEGRVQFIDIEYAWILGHEDLQASGIQFLWGKENETFDTDHGTSVLGVVLMQDNGLGGLGITPKVKAQVVSRTSPGGTDSIEQAIAHATANLKFGDIILLETQVSDTDPPVKLWPAEIELLIFRAIELATNNGIIVIEAAANGDGYQGYNLSEFTDENGKRILDPDSADFKDSGAIIVAAASHVVTNGRHGKRRNSNYGKRVNCYGWGFKVFTSDDPAKHQNEPPYRKEFRGTSSASAIVAGAAIAVQSIFEASRQPRLSPAQMRDILSNPSNGTGSRNAIGIMPDLKAIIDNIPPALS